MIIVQKKKLYKETPKKTYYFVSYIIQKFHKYTFEKTDKSSFSFNISCAN